MEGKLLTIAFATARDAEAAGSIAKQFVDTSGVPAESVEVLAFASNRRALCGVYNDAMRPAAGRYLVLVHDDVSFEKSPGWAKALIRVFERSPRFSILGVAGSSILQETGYWGHPQVMCGHVHHRVDGVDRLDRFALPHEQPVRAASLDGVFIAARTADIKDLVLDEDRFDGFHFYDAELCMQANLRGLRIGVTDAIDLIHFSTGCFGDAWARYQQVFKEKYRDRLPFNPLENTDLFPFRKFASKPKTKRSVAVLIPVRDQAERVVHAARGIQSRWSAKQQPAIYAVDAGAGPSTLSALRHLEGVTVVETGCTGIAAAFNEVVLRRDLVREELLLLHHDEIELVNDTPSHLLHAWDHAQHPGVVGARLHFPNGLIRSDGASLVVDPRMGLVTVNHGYNTLWNYSEHPVRSTTVCSAALALIDKALYRKVGGLSEAYDASLEEVELSLRCLLAGKTNVQAGDAVAIHHGRIVGLEDGVERETLLQDVRRLAAFVQAHIDKLHKHVAFLQEPTAAA